MTHGTFSGYQCWKDHRITEVINLDAIAIDPVNFLATHTPIDRIEYSDRSPEGLNNTGEDALLRELQRLSEEQQHAFIVIEGMPGSGKSHLIRWLKERYANVQRGLDSKDVVLLIERANSSLRGTLRQIVDSEALRGTGIYTERTLAEQIDRLQHAADLLSEEALGDSLLNALQVAAIEVKLPDEEGAARLLQNNAAGNMLLDQTFRQHLKRPSGPIDRLVRHLAEGRNTQQASDSLPGFEPGDFLLDPEQLRKIEMAAYQEVRILAKRMGFSDRPKERQNYAEFLNRRLNFAVGRTTSLSADDLKQVFNDIRRALRQRGYQLVLFIEDITSFTGIDAGLIDVLATQHTGQENTQFARLISVVGITNDYYQSRFPDNMKQRVTHRLHLSLNNKTSVLLDREGAIADISSRYLNAMRLGETELRQWMSSGASPAQLPNACNACPFKTECHDSFGYVAIGNSEDDASLHLGLYPFNDSSLTTMFDSLSSGTRTPRALLTNVLESVLVRHGSKVKQGTFPPARTELGSEFVAPALVSTGGHDRTIRSQAPGNSDRLESLMVFWGDRTVTSTSGGKERRVGSLPKGVFTAFQLPFIDGISESTAVPPARPQIVDPKLGGQTPLPLSPPRKTRPTESDLVLQDLGNWRQGGTLQRYESLRRGLVTFVRDAIDWEQHGISPALYGGRLDARRFKIQDQSGRTDGDVLELSRSDELYDALLAVHALRSIGTLENADLAGHLLALRGWLDTAEKPIIGFVRKPTSTTSDDVDLHDVLTADALLLASLEGHLLADQQGSEGLGRILIQTAAAATADGVQAFSTSWRESLEAAGPYRSSEWTALRRKITAARSFAVWSKLLEAANRSQGGSANVRFVDADVLLTSIDRFKKSGWSLETFAHVENLNWVAPIWEDPLRVLQDLRGTVEHAMERERAMLAESREKLLRHIGDEQPDTILEEIRSLLSVLRSNDLPHSIDRVTLTGNVIEEQLTRLKNLIDETQISRNATRLSHADQISKQVQTSIFFFDEVERIISRYEMLINDRLSANRLQSVGAHTGESTRAAFDDLSKIISRELRTLAVIGNAS